MQLNEAINHLREDLHRYAQHPKANPRAVAFRKAVLNAVIDAVNEMEKETIGLRTALHQSREAQLHAEEQHQALRQWCMVHGVDLGDWDRLPQQWKQEHLGEAVRVAGLVRVVDGLHDTRGTRFAKNYRNVNAFAYTVISSCAQEALAREVLRRLGEAEPPADLPYMLWYETESEPTYTLT